MTNIGHNGAPPFSGGWIKLHRSMMTHWIVGFGQPVKPADPKKGAFSRGEAWIDLIMECRYEDGYVVNGGRKMLLQRGHLFGATSWLAARWNWTNQTVRTWLDKLENDGMITRHVPGSSSYNKHVGKAATDISVCNYDYFQRPEWGCEPEEQQTTNNQTTNKQQTSNNNYKKERKEKNGRAGAHTREVHDACQFEAFSGLSVATTETQGDLVIDNVRKTISHKKFFIDVRKIEMELATRRNLTYSQVKELALDVARDWSATCSKGRMPHGFTNPVKFIVEHILQTDDPKSEIRFEGESIVLAGDTRKHWIEQFDGDERLLDLALQQAVPYVQRANGNTSFAGKVVAQLARQAGDLRIRQKNSRAIAERRANDFRPKNGKPVESREDVIARYKKLEGGI